MICQGKDKKILMKIFKKDPKRTILGPLNLRSVEADPFGSALGIHIRVLMTFE